MGLWFDKSAAVSPHRFASLLITLLICLLLIHRATPENRDLTSKSNQQNSSDVEFQNISSPITPQLIYSCLPSCECNYDKPSLRLEVTCHGQSFFPNRTIVGSSTSHDLDLSDGVRVLVIRNVVLHEKSISRVVPPLAQDTLAELELFHVTIDHTLFFNSELFKKSKSSLRKISIKNGKTMSSDIFLMDYREMADAFATLDSLDSLTICDSNPALSQIMLQALPFLNHIQVFNSSVSNIYYYSFSHLHSLQSLNLSYNHLPTIPSGLFDNLASLKYLDISHNQIKHLQEDVFKGLTSLRKLDLSHNTVEYVDAEVFTHLEDLQSIDLSHNDVIQFFEPYFKHNNNLRVLKMSNAWVANTFINEHTANRSYKEMEGLITTLRSMEVIDLSDNQMTIIPETLSHVSRLTHVYLHGNPWICTCEDRWFLDWISTTNVSIGKHNGSENTFCTLRQGEQFPIVPYIKSLSNSCNSTDITARYPFKYYAVMGKDKVLSCHTRNPPLPRITWITPSKKRITITSNYTSVHQYDESQHNPIIHPDGALVIQNVDMPDYGLYLCVASYDDLNITHYVHLGMDVSIFEDVRLMSIIVGLISSFGFLILVLLAQAIRFLLLRSGLHCIAVRTANQARRVRAFFDSMEQNKNSQLDWLRQNYNMQAKKIQDNCISQLERIRDSYTNQTKNLSEFRDYSAQQLATMRDQYQDQIRKVASYSAHRLGKVRENYVFNRNRVGKFSSHQLIRLREAYKWQAQTLSKILENLPQGLNLDACRGVAACGRAESVYLDDDMQDFIAHSSTSDRSSLRHPLKLDDKNEHISLLIPPEFFAQYLNPPNCHPEIFQETAMLEIAPRIKVDHCDDTQNAEGAEGGESEQSEESDGQKSGESSEETPPTESTTTDSATEETETSNSSYVEEQPV